MKNGVLECTLNPDVSRKGLDDSSVHEPQVRSTLVVTSAERQKQAKCTMNAEPDRGTRMVQQSIHRTANEHGS